MAKIMRMQSNFNLFINRLYLISNAVFSIEYIGMLVKFYNVARIFWQKLAQCCFFLCVCLFMFFFFVGSLQTSRNGNCLHMRDWVDKKESLLEENRRNKISLLEMMTVTRQSQGIMIQYSFLAILFDSYIGNFVEFSLILSFELWL